MARLTLRLTPISIVVDAFNVVPFFKVEQLEGIEVECTPRGWLWDARRHLLTPF